MGGRKYNKRFCREDRVVGASEGLLLKKARYLKEFSAFLCMRRCKSLGSLRSLFWYAPQLWGASILFSHPVSSSCSIHSVSGCSVWCFTGEGSVLSFLGVYCGGEEVPAVADDCNIVCLLMWQATFLIRKAHRTILVQEKLLCLKGK